MEDGLTLAALGMALRQRRVLPGPVHGSDSGSQYASSHYTELLKANGIQIGMSRNCNPWDNARCEWFMKALEYEEVQCNKYRGLAKARASIVAFIEKVYSQKRLHSALSTCRPPGSRPD